MTTDLYKITDDICKDMDPQQVTVLVMLNSIAFGSVHFDAMFATFLYFITPNAIDCFREYMYGYNTAMVKSTIIVLSMISSCC